MLACNVMRPLLLVALLVGLGCRCHREGTRPAAVGPQKRAQTEEECRACKGEWGVHGLAQALTCLCRTHDAGKACKDGLECEGECDASEGKTEVTDPGPPRRGYFVGKCTEFDLVFGCRKLIMDGTAAKGPGSLDEPMAEICVD